uniref:Uncharacterized protein n=1 Tax=Vespula pensylvanica TaxID=30213 RepID=A0A834P157_VESPE|nr:hypothetical protein H0235_009076 [Vespula pensylvanica]
MKKVPAEKLAAESPTKPSPFSSSYIDDDDDNNNNNYDYDDYDDNDDDDDGGVILANIYKFEEEPRVWYVEEETNLVDTAGKCGPLRRLAWCQLQSLHEHAKLPAF